MCENNWLKHLSSERFLQRTFFCMFYHMSNNGDYNSNHHGRDATVVED